MNKENRDNREVSTAPNDSEKGRGSEKTSNGPAVFAKRAGTGDFLAKSTKETHCSALKWFSTFLEEARQGPFEALKEEDVTIDLLQRFGGYLIDKADTATKLDEMLKARTAQQYISAVTTELSNRFPSLKTALKEDGEVYTKIRAEVYQKTSRACNKLVRLTKCYYYIPTVRS
jgi:hypothetical protein